SGFFGALRDLPSFPTRRSSDLTLQVVGQDTVVLKAYRYAGLGFRASEQWTNKNSKIITSEGNDRKTADGSLARWVIAEGDLDGRSEEHTSELQSRENLVCRLLL